MDDAHSSILLQIMSKFTARVICYKTYLSYYHGDRSGTQKTNIYACCAVRSLKKFPFYRLFIKKETSYSKHYQVDTTSINSSMKLVLLLLVVNIVVVSDCFARSKFVKCLTTTHSHYNVLKLFQSNVTGAVLL